MRVPVTDLVGHPGETRRIARTLTRQDIGEEPWGPATDALGDTVDVDLHLDSVVEGIVVRGVIAFDLALDCARCLEPVVRRHEVEVSELFQDPNKLEEDEEPEPGYELVDGRTAIDLERMLHDVVVLELPVRVHCDRVGCAPAMAEDVALRSEVEEAERRATEPDPRWQKLADLDLPNE